MTELIRVRELPVLPPRRADDHKGSFGRAVILAGSRGMVGAACLAAQAALRSGAGLSVLAVPEGIAPIAMAKLTCEMVVALPETAAGTLDARALDPVLAAIREAQAVAIGPGIRQDLATGDLLAALLPRVTVPLVLDADALNLIAGRPAILAGARAPVVLTPHPGEMARLCGRTTAEVQADREAIAVGYAASHDASIVALKGHRTVVTDGARIWVNTTGNSGMATGGTGDVLTGVVAGLIARGLAPFDAAVLGTYVHGLAGDLAAATVGEESLIATDVLAYLPRAFRVTLGR